MGRNAILPRLCTAALMSSAVLALQPRTAGAQSCPTVGVAQAWPAPLDRRVAVRARDISLREGLDRVAVAARFRISYSAEFLPLDRRVCLSADSISAGDALAQMLVGVSVASIVTAPDHVVIAPSRPVPAAAPESVQTLERVVVTGSAGGGARRPLSIAVDVIDRPQLEQSASGSLSSTLDGNVAGMWVWEQSPASLLARYGSIRGASSFGVSHPKVYVDGIEVANPLLLTELNPAALERVEVIRGPQGAALYGADAISGVVNIITRREGLQAGGHRADFVSRAGLSQTEFAERAALAQSHSITLRTGTNVKSGSLGMSVTTLGDYVPEAFSRDVKLNGGFRVITSSASMTGTARFHGKTAALGQNPLMREESLSVLATRDSLPQSVRQYTVGFSSTLLTGTTWVPSFSAGVDGYRLANVPNDLALIPSALDSALNRAEGGADRVTFRTALVGQHDLAERRSLTLTFAAEHSYLRETLALPPGDPRMGDRLSWRSNSGLVAQANFALNEAVYLTGGARLERNDGIAFGAQAVALPMAGIAFVRDVGPATVKLRGAYGVGIRPARTGSREVAQGGLRNLGESLDPERQSGVEFGADLFVTRRLALHITRFDQTATGLIQPVAIPGGVRGGTLEYVLQNVGEISNRGWELRSSADLGAVSLSGAFSTVDSHVGRIATNYIGDLRVGDRMLGVPTGTASLTAGWDAYGWRASMTASRAFNWVNYDRMRLAREYASCDSCTAQNVAGQQLRSYWMHYAGVPRLRGSLSRDLQRGLGLRLTVDNLTNVQRGEPDNITVLPGRTVLFGLSAKIR